MSDQSRIELVVDGVVSVKEAAKFLNLSRTEVSEQMNQGNLAYSKVGRRRLISRRSMLDLLARTLVTVG